MSEDLEPCFENRLERGESKNLETVEVHGDAEGNGHLISPCVPLPNGARAVVDPARGTHKISNVADPI